MDTLKIELLGAAHAQAVRTRLEALGYNTSMLPTGVHKGYYYIYADGDCLHDDNSRHFKQLGGREINLGHLQGVKLHYRGRVMRANGIKYATGRQANI